MGKILAEHIVYLHNFWYLYNRSGAQFRFQMGLPNYLPGHIFLPPGHSYNNEN